VLSLTAGRNNAKNAYTYVSGTESIELNRTSKERDLGIVIDSDLDFGEHIQLVGKANRQLGLIKQCFIIRDRQSLLLLYKSTVRPILEYGSAVWSPWKVKYVKIIEQIQRRFTKLVYGMMGLSYEQRLKELNLHTLAFRRKREQLIQVYKLLHNHYDADYRNLFEKVDYDAARGNGLKLKTIRTRLSLRSRFFTVAVIHAWNHLPNDVVNASTLNSLKTGVRRHLKAEWFTLD